MKLSMGNKRDIGIESELVKGPADTPQGLYT